MGHLGLLSLMLQLSNWFHSSHCLVSEHSHKVLPTVLVGEPEGDMMYMASAWLCSIIIWLYSFLEVDQGGN